MSQIQDTLAARTRRRSGLPRQGNRMKRKLGIPGAHQRRPYGAFTPFLLPIPTLKRGANHLSVPGRWFTKQTGDMVYTFAENSWLSQLWLDA